ncbi:unnamed protein product [Chrysoparadoxa australica]
MKLFVATALLAVPIMAFVPHALPGSMASRAVSLNMVEQVDVEVVSSPPKPSSKPTSSVETSELVDAAKDVLGQAKEAFSNINVDNIQDDFKEALNALTKNIKSGEPGERKEDMVAVQAVVLACLVLGNVPILGGPLEFLAGPGLLLGGLGLTGASVLSLGSSLSPWPVPAEGNILKTTGPYSLCRHPLYTGVIAFGFGLGFTSDSFVRIALAAVLAYLLDQKATIEEEELIKIHPAYKTYQEEVSQAKSSLH